MDKIWKMTAKEWIHYKETNIGICTNCHFEKYNVTPEQVKARCAHCETETVYGVVVALDLGYIEIK